MSPTFRLRMRPKRTSKKKKQFTYHRQVFLIPSFLTNTNLDNVFASFDVGPPSIGESAWPLRRQSLLDSHSQYEYKLCRPHCDQCLECVCVCACKECGEFVCLSVCDRDLDSGLSGMMFFSDLFSTKNPDPHVHLGQVRQQALVRSLSGAILDRKPQHQLCKNNAVSPHEFPDLKKTAKTNNT